MRKLFAVLCTVVAVAIIVVCANSLRADAQRRSNWEDSREIISVVIQPGDSLDGLWAKYGPHWMDRRDYRIEIIELNNLDSAMLYVGDKIKLYVEGGNQ